MDFSKLLYKHKKRIEREKINMERIKRFYTDRHSFNVLMNKIIEKDFNKIENSSINGYSPSPWNVMFVIMDIVQHEGIEHHPYDVLTRTYSSRTLEYMGWTFSMVHGENTLVSIYNRKNELIYRF